MQPWQLSKVIANKGDPWFAAAMPHRFEGLHSYH
jgi:hypothetical protein